MEKREPCGLWVRMENGAAAMETAWWFLGKLHTE